MKLSTELKYKFSRFLLSKICAHIEGIFFVQNVQTIFFLSKIIHSDYISLEQFYYYSIKNSYILVLMRTKSVIVMSYT